jgi:glutamate synthase (NADPH/NADH) small chain
LAAAHALNRAGLEVTVYEKDARPGGLLRYGIPDFKLEKWVIDRRLTLMEEEGVVFECGVDAGKDVSYRFLRDRFDAIVLATGAGVPRDLPVRGRDLAGIHFAMDFLTQQNRLLAGEPLDDAGRITAAGKSVVVIGGGDTGSDCIGTSWRQGARAVTQLEILPEPPTARAESTPWPQWPLMRRDSSSHKEGDTSRFWSVDTTAFEGERDHVARVRCSLVEWAFDVSRGQACPTRVAGSEFGLEADLVLLAMGFVAPGPTGLVDHLGLESGPRGFIARDAGHMTGVEGVFVTGDMQSGPSLVVRAIADGMETARRVLTHLHVTCDG